MNAPLLTIPGSLRVAATLSFLIVCLVVLPSVASAAQDPAVDQYSEHVPSVTGDKPTKQLDHGSRDDGLPSSTRQTLRQAGIDGDEVTRLVAVGGRASNPGGGSNNAEDATGSGSSPSAIGAIGNGLSGGGGLGVVFPLILLVVAGLAAALVLTRRQRTDRG